MPYKDRAQQLAAQRAWNRKQTERRRDEHAKVTHVSTQRSNTFSGSGAPALIPSIPVPVPKIEGRTAPALQPLRSPHRQLGKYYTTLRQLGFADETAQELLRETREARQTEQQQRAQRDAWESEVDALIPPFRESARYWLQVHTGMWTSADVERKAREFAEREVHSHQKPRLPDSEPKRIAGPTPTQVQRRARPDAAPGRRAPAALAFSHQNVSGLGEPHTSLRETLDAVIAASISNLSSR